MSEIINETGVFKRISLKRILNAIYSEYREHNEILDVTIPEAMLDEFGSKYVKITKEPDQDPDSNYVDIDKVLDTFYRLSQKKGKITSFRIISNRKPNGILDKISFLNCKVEHGGSYTTIRKALLFHFITYLEHQQIFKKIYHISVEPHKLNRLKWIEDKFQSENISPIQRPPKVLSKNLLKAAYMKACNYLENDIHNDLIQIDKSNTQYMLSEENRINKYYSRLIDEEARRIKRLEDQIKTMEYKIKKHRKLGALEKYLIQKTKLSKQIEKEKYEYLDYVKELEIKQKNDLKRIKLRNEINCQIQLIGLSIVNYSIVRKNLLLYNGHSKANISIYYNLNTGINEDYACMSCNKPTSKISLCSKSHVVCKKCLKTCMKC
ncbi:hypothetical protein A3K80_00900 [Candidatus Bathyarchaeota archaeon RBG_13_38_9]|nr:MAG: hypothetical protein A3K80_00900 [Candidatus Bathyarchaeota archaeon RBG_13_38_9]